MPPSEIFADFIRCWFQQDRCKCAGAGLDREVAAYKCVQ